MQYIAKDFTACTGDGTIAEPPTIGGPTEELDGTAEGNFNDIPNESEFTSDGEQDDSETPWELVVQNALLAAAARTTARKRTAGAARRTAETTAGTTFDDEHLSNDQGTQGVSSNENVGLNGPATDDNRPQKRQAATKASNAWRTQ